MKKLRYKISCTTNSKYFSSEALLGIEVDMKGILKNIKELIQVKSAEKCGVLFKFVGVR